ncbi:hypothetical protein LCGC14_0681230 [marine sediment metagenome]|uniref:Uncharacterized protein n=1 Tax=marine sediment metagenome TaxID=412755 RepID=A0A0F9TW69_9ZZZZ
MARILEEELQEILPSPTDLSPYIELGNRFVTETLGSVTSLTVAQLKDIELFVSAHFAAMTVERGTPRFEQVGDSRVSWEVKAGDGLKSTRFGKMALLLDSSKTLAKLSVESVAEFRVFGG